MSVGFLRVVSRLCMPVFCCVCDCMLTVLCCCVLRGSRSLRSLLDGEMEHSAGLRQETDALRRRLDELEERHTAKVQALGRWVPDRWWWLFPASHGYSRNIGG